MHNMTWNRARKTEKGGKLETHTVEPGIWQEKWPKMKMRNSHNRTCNMARNNEKLAKWEKHTLRPAIGQEN